MKKLFTVTYLCFLIIFLSFPGDSFSQNVGIGTTAPASLFHVNGALRLGLASSTNGSLIFNNSSNANTVSLNTGITAAGGYSLTLPVAQGSAASVLTNNGSGTLTWAAPGISSWGLTGNAATVNGTNFIGTTDNIPFNIRVNNQKAGRIDVAAAGNTFFGYQSGNVNSGNNFNTGIGQQALFSNSIGYNNTANGYQALYSNTTGASNTANGRDALASNSTGSENTAIGNSSLYTQSFNNAGVAWSSYNTAVGREALYFNQPTTTNNGINNTALGYRALFANSTGAFNTANGVQALYSNST